MTEELTAGFFEALASRYRVDEECGRGGTSVVYRALDLATDRIVAVKVMRPELSAAAGAERFLREVRIAQSLQHPRIASLLDFGELSGVLYCVFPFIEGETLRRRLARDGALPVDESLRLTREVGEALSYAHAIGVIHRDVKPENVLISDGHAVLTDFGIARAIVVATGDRVTDSGVAVGTPAYMSPEQATAEAVLDERTDQYALAVCLYEMLAGNPPFVGRTSQAVIARQVAEPPPPLEIVRPTAGPGVVAAIERALAKVPADRFDSVNAFLRALSVRDNRPMRRLRRRRWPAVLSAAALCAIAALWLLLRPHALDASRVLVFPARTTGAALAAGSGLRIADAIQVAVEHTEPLRWIPAWESLDSAERADPGRLRAEDARRLAHRRGARYYVLSALETAAARTQLVIWLYDAAGDSLLIQVSATDSTGMLPPTALAIGALPRLLAKMLDPSARVDLSPLTDRKLPAIVKLFEGEEAYRTARFSIAFGFYRQAVAEDSMFAYAALKGAQAASWLNQLEDAIDLVHRARANERLLPPKYRPYLRGIEHYLDGRADSAVTAFQAALTADRYWAEAATALGEVYYHLLPNAAPVDSLAEASFERAIAIDSLFVPPLFHLAEISLRRRDSAHGARYLERMRRVGADVARTRHLAVMTRCADGSLAAEDWDAIARVSANDAMLAARELGAAGRMPRCAADGFRAVLRTPDAPAGTVWAAVLGLHGALVAMGRPDEAVRLLDSARTTVSTKALAFALIGVYADSAFRPLAQQAEAFGHEKFGPFYDTAKPRSAWAFGVWEAWKRNGPVLEAVAARLADLAQQTGAPAHVLAAASLAAHRALVRGDTADAIRRFTPLPPVAPRDSLAWEFLEPVATDRLTLGELLLARHRPREALDVLTVFDHPAPIAYVAFVRRSLELRLQAATQLGRSSLARGLRERLRALGDPAQPRS